MSWAPIFKEETPNKADVHKSLRELLNQVKSENDPFMTNGKEVECEKLDGMVNDLLSIIMNDVYPIETSLLAGTCLNYMLQKYLPSAAKYVCSAHLLNWITEQKDCFSSAKTANESTYSHDHATKVSHKHFSVLPFLDNQCSQETAVVDVTEPSFPHLAVLYGIFSSLKPKDCDLNKHQDFLLWSFTVISRLCHRNTFFHYHSLKLMVSWFKAFIALFSLFRETLSASQLPTNGSNKRRKVFMYGSEVVSQVMDIVDTNWENPLHGDTELVTSILNLLLEAHTFEATVFGKDDGEEEIIPFLLKKAASMPWTMRKKYRLLAAVTPYLGYEMVLRNIPNFPKDAFQRLAINNVANAIAESYKTLVKDMKQKSEKEFLEKWEQRWLISVLESLMSTDMLIFQNTTIHILPWTCEHVPGAFNILMKELETMTDVSVSHSQAEAAMFRVARQVGKCSLDEVTNDTLLNLLSHQSDIVRIEAFSFLCTSPKKAEAPTKREVELVKEFIPHNLNIDSPAFRSQFIKQMSNFLLRIHDSCVSSLVHFQKHEGPEPPESLILSIDFIDWLVNALLSNLFPGACYQRRHTCLLLLQKVFNLFDPPSKMNGKPKSYLSDRTHLLRNYAKNIGKWNFWTSPKINYLISCISDAIDEVVSPNPLIIPSWLSTFYFYYWMLLGCQKDIGLLATDIIEENDALTLLEALMQTPKSTVIRSLVTSALSLCNGPRFQDCSSGAMILRVVFVTCIMEGGWKVEITKDLCNVEPMRDPLSACLFLKSLNGLISRQFELAQKDLLSAARHGPIHGLLLAVRCCLANKKVIFGYLVDKMQNDVKELLQEWIRLCSDIVNYMLSLLASKSSSGEICAPSFEEMGEAVESIVNCTSSSDTQNNNLSADYQLVLACCWISIKESCNLLADIAEAVLLTDTTLTDSKQLSDIATLLVMVLTRCRHKGAIEGCCSALNRLIKSILKCGCKEFHEIPHDLLKNVLEKLTPSAVVSSVTRRSAGLALLIQAIVTANCGPQENVLLKYAFEELMNVCNMPLPSSINDQVDLPQAHALHILRAVVNDNSASRDVFPFLGDLIPICVHGFSSHCWGIRNGSLQLFGAICTRLLGQKKSREDDFARNCVTANELFGRIPNLQKFLLHQLQSSAAKFNAGGVCPDLVPLLTLLSQLAPTNDDNSVICSLPEFLMTLHTLLTSHVWTIRCLASKSIAVILSEDMRRAELFRIIDSLPEDKTAKGLKFNHIHGNIILMKDILLICQAQGCLERDLSQNLLSALKSRYWLLTEANPCFPVKTEILKIQGMLSDKDETLCLQIPSLPTLWNPGIAMWLKEMVSSSLSGVSREIRIGECLSMMKTFFDNQDVLESILEILLKLYEENDPQNLAPSSAYDELCLKETLELLVHIKNHSLSLQAVQLVVKLLSRVIPVVNQNSPHSILNSRDKLNDLVKVLVHGQYGLTTSSLGLVLWSEVLLTFLQDDMLCDRGELFSSLEEWASLIEKASDPHQYEDTRLQAAIAISKSGASILHKCKSLKPLHENVALKIFSAALNLLQDEDTVVRQTVTPFASHLIHYSQKGSMTTTFHAAKAIKVLCTWMMQEFSDCPSFSGFLWDKIRNEPDTKSELLKNLKPSQIHLFEQSDRNIYAEPVYMCYLLTDVLKNSLENLRKADESQWMKLVVKNIEFVLNDVKVISSYFRDMFEENKSMWSLSSLAQPRIYLTLCKLACQIDVTKNQHPHLHDQCILDMLTEIESKAEPLRSIWMQLQPVGAR